jgi:hypothetical protein
MSFSSGYEDDERLLGPPLAALRRAGLIAPGQPRLTGADDTLLEFARLLPTQELAELYACPWCSKSMIQGLSHPARQ